MDDPGNGRAVVITGAGSGIGRQAALALHAAGHRVALAGRREEALGETAAAIAGTGENVLVAPCDVTEPESVRTLFERCLERFGRVDVLVNNAGVFGPAAPFDEISHGQWSEVVSTNLTGAFLCAQEAFRHMKAAGGGRIINNGSLSAHVPRPHAAAYTATKHAITGLTKAISLEGRAYGIACGQIDVGNAATDMTAAMSHGVLQANGSVAAEPTIDVRNVAEAIVFMAGLPLDANVQFMTVMATAMPFIGRG
ncbi:SDR family oxidoreductase [Nonomuraea jiangxiensis]|uniref:NADP-dependent 3-hydroxy acid dehydrogenase YdfG n=1 Tax=Nonomuraea jiangxiensis TaxID=633440 RepID=A0A1G9R1F1_9ACTN|nr:SDR family oxidoreductase [Nonomuraea jiangxiensis]SDM17116.1 NADP-dependent 3-hydroxy acid dehydrogenase YdfG [Nonomuraea jiangxiensis]